MLNYIWPVALIVFSNVVYQICAKSAPENINPFASLCVTYSIGTVFSFILFAVTNKGENIIKEFSKINWASAVLGLVIVGLESGFLYAYSAGWKVSTLSVTQSSVLAAALIVVGAVLYKEHISLNKIIGIAVCLAGLVIINIKD